MTTLSWKIESEFSDVIKKIFIQKIPNKIAVAVSGGSDSIALSLLIYKLFSNQNPTTELFFITIDHKIRPDSSKEAEMVRDLLVKKSIPNHFILSSDNLLSLSKNIESQARELRYELLFDFCKKRHIDYLFVGHHKQDVAENFLIRLFRGSGIDGLSAMEYVSKIGSDANPSIVRPLLDFTKESLKSYLLSQQTEWFEDPSNQDHIYLRNKIRSFLDSFEDKDLINDRIQRAAQDISISREIITNDMIFYAHKLIEISDLGYFLVKKKAFLEIEKQKALRYLSWILMDLSGQFYKPRLTKLNNLYDAISQRKILKPTSLYGSIIEDCDNEKIIIYRERSKISSCKITEEFFHWDRFLIRIKNQKLIRLGIEVGVMSPYQFNMIAKNSAILSNIKNPLKKVFHTIAVFFYKNEIIAIPQISYYPNQKYIDDIDVNFSLKSRLYTNESTRLPNRFIY